MKETDIKNLEERFEPAVATGQVAETINISC